MASEAPPAQLYLDQKDWIALARLRAGKPVSDGLREAATALATEISKGNVVVPFSESHVLETGRISDRAKRQSVATMIVAGSRRHAIAPLHTLCREEADAFLRLRFGAVVDAVPAPFGKGLAFALGLNYDELEVPWPPDSPESDVAMAEMFAIAEPSRIGLSAADIERRRRWDEWATIMMSASESLIKDRSRFNERDRLSALTVAMLGNALLHRAIGLDVHRPYLEYLRTEGFWAVVREMPSLAVLTELHRVRYPDVKSPWTVNDYHDIRFLSVALAYCSAVCPDKRWGDLAQRSEYIANRGVIIATGQNALAYALRELGGRGLPVAQGHPPNAT